MTDLEKDQKEQYQSQSLSAGELAEIKRTDVKAPAISQSRPWHMRRSGRLAASVLLILGILGGWLAFGGNSSVVDALASEIAEHHEKHLPPEFISNDFTELGTMMDKLDFELQSFYGVDGALELAGARYCSIDDRVAAQVRLINSAGVEFTFYQFRAAAEDELTTEHHLRHNEETTIEVWSDGELVYGLAFSE